MAAGLVPLRTRFATRLGTVSACVAGPASGEPLLMMHGIGGNAGGWAEQFGPLSEGHRLIAWDAPGYGESDDVATDTPEVGDFAEAAVALLDAAGIERCALLGHSLGGLVAARLAATHPSRVTRLILADCSSGHASYPAEERERMLKNRNDPLAKDDPLAYGRKRAPNVFSKGASPELVERGARVLAQIRSPGFQRAAHLVANGDIFPDLASIAAPTLVLCGTDDRVTPEALNQRIAAGIRGARYKSIPDAGHWTFLEKPAAFNRDVLEFLAAP